MQARSLYTFLGKICNLVAYAKRLNTSAAYVGIGAKTHDDKGRVGRYYGIG